MLDTSKHQSALYLLPFRSVKSVHWVRCSSSQYMQDVPHGEGESDFPPIIVRPDPGDLCTIMYTSGTTGVMCVCVCVCVCVRVCVCVWVHGCEGVCGCVGGWMGVGVGVWVCGCVGGWGGCLFCLHFIIWFYTDLRYFCHNWWVLFIHPLASLDMMMALHWTRRYFGFIKCAETVR